MLNPKRKKLNGESSHKSKKKKKDKDKSKKVSFFNKNIIPFRHETKIFVFTELQKSEKEETQEREETQKTKPKR